MTALLMKDFYTLIKQTKLFLVIIIIFAIVPGNNISVMAVVYAAMLPMTALSYDERSKWDILAAMMPYSVKNIVFGKYMLSYIAVFVACILSATTQLIAGMIKNTGVDSNILFSLLMTACASITILAVNLPVMFRFGVEKGRIAFLVLFSVIGALVIGFGDKMDSLLSGADTDLSGIMMITLLIAAVVNIVSVFIAIKWYHRKSLA